MRTLRITVVVGLLAAALTGTATAADAEPATGAAPAVDAAPTADGARWHVRATLGLGIDDVATSCPTVSVCTAAAGGELLTTADGGTTWTRNTPAVPASIAAIVDLDCPTTTVCLVVARRTDRTTALLTGPGTGPFTAVAAPDPGTATAVACPGPSHCLLTDGATVWTTRDRGVTWQPSSLPLIAHSDAQITCVTGTSRCAVFGNSGFTPVVDITADDGATWTVRNPGAFDGLYALDCPTVSVCVAGGRGNGIAMLRRTTDGGATWTSVPTPGQPYGVRSISCATDISCSAFGLTPGDTPYAWSTANGTSWTATPVTAVDTSLSPEVDCPAAGRCRAVAGGVAYVSDDGGATWPDRSLPAVPDMPRAISCPGTRSCVAVGVDAAGRPLAVATTDAGTTWASHPLPATVGQPTAVDCVAGTTTCVTLGAYAPPGNGLFRIRSARSTDLGATWSTGRPANVQGSLRSLACPTVTTCLAGGYDAHSAGTLWLSTDGAATWTVLTPPVGLSQDNAVACTGPTTCVVVSDPANAAPVAFVTRNLGRTWKQRAMPGDRNTYYADVDCAASTCVAAGFDSGDGAMARSTDGGTTWKRVTVPPEAQILLAVSCASDAVCAATAFDFRPHGGAIAVGTNDAGATWTVHPLDAGNVIGGDIACVATRCYVPQQSRFGNPVILTGAP